MEVSVRFAVQSQSAFNWERTRLRPFPPSSQFSWEDAGENSRNDILQKNPFFIFTIGLLSPVDANDIFSEDK